MVRGVVGAGGAAATLLFLFIVSTVALPLTVRGAPTVDFIVITNGPNGTGSWVAGRNYIFADTETFWAAGYNRTSGWVEDVEAYWYVPSDPGNGSAFVVALNESYGSSVAVRAVGYGTAFVRATYYEGGYNYTLLQNTTGPLHVSVDNVDSVVIRTDYDGGGSWVGPTAYRLYASDDFHAAAYNATQGYLGDIAANWTSSAPSVGLVYLEAGNGTGHAGIPFGYFVTVGEGFTYVTAMPIGTSLSNTTGRLTVMGIDAIAIVDAPNGAGSWVASRDYLFGDSDRFWAAAYNATFGWIADVSVYWTTGTDPTGGSSGGRVIRGDTSYGTTVRVDTNGYGVASLNATFYEGGGERYSNTTGPLRVSVDNVDSVVIRSDRGGFGRWVGDTRYDVGDTDPFYAAAYNATQGFLGDIVANWTSRDPSVGYVVPANGDTTICNPAGTIVCYPFVTFHAVGAGVTYVNATPVGATVTNSTGRLIVTTITVDYVQIRDAPNGGGTVLESRTYYPGEQDTFYAAGYSRIAGFLGDTVADWTSNNTSACKVNSFYGGPAHGSSVQLLLRGLGVCAVTVVASTSSGTVTNTTGPLTVAPRTLVTVDDSGGADFTKIQDAVDFAQDGYKIFVYAGSYDENVVVRKELEIVGQSRTSVLLDGGGLDGVLIAADRVVLHNFTILNAHYGVYQDRTNNTRIYDNTIKDYSTGLFNEHTLNAWVAFNLITQGHIGIVTNVSFDDAIRFNEISYNDVYGAKSYNTRLRNCFNWNSFHDNKVAYFHDPTTEYPPMEFDGNVFTDNEVGVKVENASSIRLTNNTFTGGLEGVLLLNSSAEVHANTFASVGTAIRCRASGSNLTDNRIWASDAGIVCDGGSPRIEGNDVQVASGEALVLSNLEGALVAGNNLHGGTLRVSTSRLTRLAPVDSVVLLTDTVVDTLVLDATSRVEVRWTIAVRAVDETGAGLRDYDIVVRDANGALAFQGATGTDGSVSGILLLTETRRLASTESRNPFTVSVSGPLGVASRTLVVSGPQDVVVTVLAVRLPPTAPPPQPDVVRIALIGVMTIASAAIAAAFAVERSRYALLALFVPLYTRVSRDKVLESYNRGRVYQYVAMNPGAHFNAIRAALDMNNGALVYHLEVLQREGLLRSRQEGMYRRFYTADTRPPPLLENGTTEAQLRVLKAIQEMPGITQKELARFLGLRQSTLAYQIERLTATGTIAGNRTGRKVQYFVRKPGA